MKSEVIEFEHAKDLPESAMRAACGALAAFVGAATALAITGGTPWAMTFVVGVLFGIVAGLSPRSWRLTTLNLICGAGVVVGLLTSGSIGGIVVLGIAAATGLVAVVEVARPSTGSRARLIAAATFIGTAVIVLRVIGSGS